MGFICRRIQKISWNFQTLVSMHHLNPKPPMSDQDRISHYNIDTVKSTQVTNSLRDY